MAEPPIELPPQAKTVQELAAIKEVPQSYIRNADNNGGGALDVSFPVLNVPTIDLQLLTSSSTGGDELDKLRSALSYCGCIQRTCLAPANGKKCSLDKFFREWKDPLVH